MNLILFNLNLCSFIYFDCSVNCLLEFRRYINRRMRNVCDFLFIFWIYKKKKKNYLNLQKLIIRFIKILLLKFSQLNSDI